MRRTALPATLSAALLLAACTRSDDPADGGFYSGVAGIAGGGYDARIAEREAGVAASQARGAELSAELAALTGEHERLKDQIIAQRAELRAQGVRLSPETETRIQTVLTAEPSASDPAARSVALSRAIADARRLSEQLAAL
jgi:septal ring factor EnvC (AmiA/AmiB activator)